MTTLQKLRRARQLMTAAVLQDDNLSVDERMARVRLLEGVDAPVRQPARSVWLTEQAGYDPDVARQAEKDATAARQQAADAANALDDRQQASELLKRLDSLTEAMRKREAVGGTMVADLLADVRGFLEPIANPEAAAEQAASEQFFARVMPGSQPLPEQRHARRQARLPVHDAKSFAAAVTGR